MCAEMTRPYITPADRASAATYSLTHTIGVQCYPAYWAMGRERDELRKQVWSTMLVLPDLDVTDAEFARADEIVQSLPDRSSGTMYTRQEMCLRDGYAIISCRERQLRESLAIRASLKSQLHELRRRLGEEEV